MMIMNKKGRDTQEVKGDTKTMSNIGKGSWTSGRLQWQYMLQENQTTPKG